MTNIQQPVLKIYTQVILYRLIDCIFIFRIKFVYTNKYEETTKETLGHEFEITGRVCNLGRGYEILYNYIIISKAK